MAAILPAGRWLPRWAAVVAAATLVGLLLGVLGPFGSYLNDGPVLRTCYWVGAMWAGVLFYGAGFSASRAVAPEGSWGAWPGLAVAVLVASVPEAAVTRLAAYRMWPELARLGLGWPLWYGQVVTIGAVAMAAAALANQERARSAPVVTGGGAAPIAPEARLRGDVIALQMEDHYVRVHTTTGSDLLLMPLARAIGMVAADGMRTHRSWWVARHAVVGVKGTPRAMSLRLVNGVVAPVSRSSVAGLRAAGWLVAEGRTGWAVPVPEVRSTLSREDPGRP